MEGSKNNNKTDELQINIFDIIRDLLRDLWMILMVGITVALCAYIVTSVVYRPAYSTNSTFVVTSKGSNNTYLNLASANTVADSLTKIFDSDIIKKKVALDIGVNEIPYHIKAAVIPETNLFELTVSAPNPKLAYQIIISIMDNYTSITNNVFKNTILDVLEMPKVPMFPDNPQNLRGIMKKAFWIGMAAMGVLLAALSILRDNIKNEKEVTKKLDTKLFGVIYHENKYKTFRSRLYKKKKSILITSPTVSFDFVESMKKIRTKFEYKASQKGYKVLLVTSVLENEGKSTIATNLALSLAQKSNKVLLIDADFRKPSIYKILQKNIINEQEIGECIIKHGDIKDAISYDTNSGLFLLIGSKQYQNSADILMKDSFRNYINVLKKIMDYVIIDTPPITVSVDTEMISDMADASLLVVKQSTARTKDVNDAIDILSESHAEVLGCVFNDAKSMIIGGKKFGYGHSYSYKNYQGYYKTTGANRN